MIEHNCGVCGRELFPEPLLKFENMPKYAQYLPDESNISTDNGITLKLYQCSGCGLIQLSSEPVPYYKEVIRAAGISNEMMEYRKNQFTDFVQKYNLNGKKVIEIGCGSGEYMSIIQKCGVNVYGLEYLSSSVNKCVEKGLNVEKGFIKNPYYKICNNPFDAFFILNFLEHIPEINYTLRGIYNNLKEDAVGLIEVPNFDMIYNKKLFSEFISDHLFYFTKSTLTNTLQLNGYDVIECKETWQNYIISAVVKKRNKLDMKPFLENQELIKKQIYDFINNYKYKEIAVWGAGHQALTVLSLLNLGNKIKYIVDSAKFKQSKYTPVTHIIIVSPEELLKNPVDAVIVMAASYSDEVVNIIRTKYCMNITIGILRDFGLEII